MQLYLTLSGNEITLPIAYRQQIQGMIYAAVESDRAYSTYLHDRSHEADGKKYKLFTFGQLHGEYVVADKLITFRDAVSLEIRSIDTRFIQLLLMRFTVGSEISLGDNILRVKACRLDDKQIFDSEITVRTLSPIVAYNTLPDGKTVFYSPNDEEFFSMLCKNAERKWKSKHGDTKPLELSVEAVADTQYKKLVTMFKQTYITAYSGCFKLRGNAELLSFLYNTGLGAKSSQGFGMFDVI